MLIPLIVGIILGGFSVVFVLQNVAIVSVAFLSWQFTASLALVLFATLMAGVVVTLLILLPNVIKDSIYVTRLNRRIKELEENNAQSNVRRAPEPVPQTEVGV
ncbi:LapA family protein [Candidatus Kaiserbacteria bacterium]|nr:LapA family protein [Candidatus Kaiserbacteria bacterium]